jgi:SAM-dependent methyltransferase
MHAKINYMVLKEFISKPNIFEKMDVKFWDDDHVARQMLSLHLNEDIEAASKTRETILKETEFIIKTTNLSSGSKILDLGCGPGLYVREFAKTGAQCIGMDISKVSIEYATSNIKSDNDNIKFIEGNYLNLDYDCEFDVITLIFYDFCALSPDEQSILLFAINKALKPGGYFIFDTVTNNRTVNVSTHTSVNEAGFWSENPYIEILNIFLYDEPKTEGLQYSIIDEEGDSRIIRIYHRLFNEDEITTLLENHSFKIDNIYNNLSGTSLSSDSDTFGIIARK